MKLWSISTTVRNPIRLRDFLKVLKQMEGVPFDCANQMKYQILLIQNRLYRPKNIPIKYGKLINNIEEEISFDIAKEVFDAQNYNDPPMRGRQSANPLNKLGFCIAKNSRGPIVITELGNLYLKGDYDISYVFLKSMLKLQFPNRWSSDFSEKDGFNISPFIGTLHFINKANEIYGDIGLTQNEFSLFIPSLININLIETNLEKLKEYRESKDKTKFIKNYAKWYYEKENPTDKEINNFFEYGDNIMRYFRMTKYFRVGTDIFGADWRINLEPLRKIEIEYLINKFSGESLKFETDTDYYKYINDIKQPEIPLDKEQDLDAIIESIKNNINKFSEENKISLAEPESILYNTNYNKIVFEEKQNFINKLRELFVEIKTRKEKAALMTNIEAIKNISDILKNNKALRKLSPEKFEKLVTDALRILNDEKLIKPNYPVDDNGEPISHAAGNQADIECFYNSYNKICEVTLDQTNKQWIRESQPVMRHLRDFETKYYNLNSYCLFIAPIVHIDTAYHFWISIKIGYDGKGQKIVPITTKQFSILLDLLLELISSGKRIKHTDIQILYDNIIKSAVESDGHTMWLNSIEETINHWKGVILSEN